MKHNKTNIILIFLFLFAGVTTADTDQNDQKMSTFDNGESVKEYYEKVKKDKEKKDLKNICKILDTISSLSYKDVRRHQFENEMKQADGFLNFALKDFIENKKQDDELMDNIGKNAETTLYYIINSNLISDNEKNIAVKNFVNAVDIGVEKLKVRIEKRKNEIKIEKQNKYKRNIEQYKEEIKKCNNGIKELKKVKANAKSFIKNLK